MRNKLLVRLCLNLMAIFMICSCRTDQFSEHEPYNSSPTFHLTTKRISLDASKHKTKILPELEKAKAGIRAFSKVNVNGKIINYGNGVSIDTDDVIYIDNGPNYHTYTFHIKRDNAPEDAPLENLLLSPLPDGSYRELLITYTLTSTEKERLKAGLMVDTKGKTQVTELANGTFNGSGQLARLVCSTKTESYWAPCSGTQQHNGSNYESCPIYNGLEQGTPPILYTIVTTTCLEQNDDIITPIDPGTGGGGGGSTGGGENPYDPPCDTSIIPSNPESGFTDENGCPIGTPTIPNLPDPKVKPCDKILENNIKAKEFLSKTKASGRITEVKTGIATNVNEKSFSLGVDTSGIEQVTPVFEDFSSTQTNIVAQSSYFTVKAGVHTHSPGGAAPPSATDVYSFIKANNINNEFTLYYTISYDGNDYVFSIVDQNKFKSFASTYPENEYTDEYGSWKYGNVIWESYYDVYNYFKKKVGKSKNESFELAMAYILKKHNSGVGLSKKDSNGDFKPIFVEEQQDPNNPKKKIYNRTENCNL